MLKNETTLAIGGVDTEENEHCEVCPLSVYRSPRLSSSSRPANSSSTPTSTTTTFTTSPRGLARIREQVWCIATRTRTSTRRTGSIHSCLFDPRGGVAGWLSKLWKARSLLYRSRFLRPNTHFAAFFEIYKICNPLHRWSLRMGKAWKNPLRNPKEIEKHPRKS